MSELALCGPNPFTVQLLLRRKMPFFQDQVTSTLPRYSSFLWLIQGHLEGRRIREDWQAGGLPLMPQKNFCSRVPQFPSYVRTDVTPPCIIGLPSNCKQSWERSAGDSWSKGLVLSPHITKTLRLEGTSGDRLVRPLAQSELEQVAQGLLQSRFECLQGWRLQNLSVCSSVWLRWQCLNGTSRVSVCAHCLLS